jgi:hypothetical protein
MMTASEMKNAVFWDEAPCGFIINRRFGGTCRLHPQGRRNNVSEEKSFSNCPTLVFALVISSTLKMEATHFSETSVIISPQAATSQKTAFFTVTAVKTSNPTEHQKCSHDTR